MNVQPCVERKAGRLVDGSASELQFGLFALASLSSAIGMVIWVNAQIAESERRSRSLVSDCEHERQEESRDLRKEIDMLKQLYVRRDEMREMEARLNSRADKQDRKLDQIDDKLGELHKLHGLSQRTHEMLGELTRRIPPAPAYGAGGKGAPRDG